MLFKYKYPKLTLLVVAVILAYFIFRNPNVNNFVSGLGNLSYFGVFIAGMLFSFGFTTPFAIGFFILLNPENIVLSAVIGGIGAMISDFAIFSLIKISFMDEFGELRKEKLVNGFEKFIKKEAGAKIYHYLVFALAGIVIASPLPDELGVSLIAGITHIKLGFLLVLSFCFNTLGIVILFLI